MVKPNQNPDPNAKDQGTGEPESGMQHDVTFPPIGEPETEPETANPEDDRFAALEARLAAAEESAAAERKRAQDTIDRLIQNQAPAQAPAQHAAPQQSATPSAPDFNDLPDPVDQPEQFKKELARRWQEHSAATQQSVQQTIAQSQEQQRAQQSEAQRLDAMWDTFKTNYPDLADKSITLNGAVAAERQELEARGINVKQSLFSDPDGFMDRVSKRMRAELGEPQAPAAPETPTANRTGGLGGGSAQSGKGGGKAKEAPGFIEQLKKTQLDSGLI